MFFKKRKIALLLIVAEALYIIIGVSVTIWIVSLAIKFNNPIFIFFGVLWVMGVVLGIKPDKPPSLFDI